MGERKRDEKESEKRTAERTCEGMIVVDLTWGTFDDGYYSLSETRRAHICRRGRRQLNNHYESDGIAHSVTARGDATSNLRQAGRPAAHQLQKPCEGSSILAFAHDIAPDSVSSRCSCTARARSIRARPHHRGTLARSRSAITTEEARHLFLVGEITTSGLPPAQIANERKFRLRLYRRSYLRFYFYYLRFCIFAA